MTAAAARPTNNTWSPLMYHALTARLYRLAETLRRSDVPTADRLETALTYLVRRMLR